MKVRLPKSWERLPESEKKIIAEVKEQEINQYLAKLQKNWLRLSCIVMSEYMGLSADDCLLYLANFKEVYRKNSKYTSEESQEKWLSEKMDEIFGKGNYPYQYIDKLEEL